MVRYIILFLILLGVMVSTATAEEGLECAYYVYQVDSLGQDVLLLADTNTFVKDIRASGFLLSFSLDVEFTEIDSANSVFNVHVVTLGPPAKTYSRNYTVEYGLPARLTGIQGKNKTEYSLTMIPLASYDVDTSLCPFNHHNDSTFKFNPTAHTDIYYVPTSLADFYWTSVKDLLEYEYRQFMSVFDLNLPGKYQLFLCPCPIRSVIWDKRFGQAIIPTRNVGFAIYSKEANTADPFIIDHAAVLRNFGYSPLFLSEGLAGYLSFAIFDMKRLLNEHKAEPLADFLDTYHYLKADPTLSDRTAATFVKFLIDSYGMVKFKQLYREADDLNLKTVLTQTYNESIDSLEQQWQTYVDTLTIPLQQFGRYISQAEVMMAYPQMVQYAQGMVKIAVTKNDSLIAFSSLKRALFFSGDYYGAASAQKTKLKLNPDDAMGWMALGSYEMMNGVYDTARVNLEKAASLEPNNDVIRFNQGLNYLYTGDTLEARKKFNDIVLGDSKGSAQPETKLMLAELLRLSKDKKDRAKAITYYTDALNIYQQQLAQGKPMPVAYLWMGIASLGLDDTGNAFNFLELAQFLETRPFYLGMINLWLGKVADVHGDHETARNYYGMVLSQPSADYHQKEARMYLDNPYTR